MQMRNKLWCCGCAIVSSLLFVTHALAADSKNCSDNQHPGTYHVEPGDLSTPTHLDIWRTTSALHSLHITVCSGELRVVPAPSNSQLHLEVTARSAKETLSDFLQEFSTNNGETTLVLSIPKKVHPQITLYVPQESDDARNSIDLGQGSLILTKNTLRGDRELNVGAGSVYAELDEKRDYGRLETDIGIGHLSDNRPGGRSGSFIVSRDAKGDGQGLLQINVGVGSIHLVPRL